MNRTLVEQLNENIDNLVSLTGYIDNYREFKDFGFLFLRDRTGTCQVVVPKVSCQDKINRGDIVTLNGNVKRNEKSKYLGIEILAERISILSKRLVGNSLVEKDSTNISLEQKLERRPDSLRLKAVREIFEFESQWLFKLREFLNRNGFLEVSTPKIVEGINEGGSSVFRLDYFGRQAELSQSPQLYHQMLLAALERVYEIGNCFRAEKYSTQRHVNEYQSLDFQLAFTFSGDEIMNFVEEMLTSSLAEHNVLGYKIPRISYNEAQRILKKTSIDKLSGAEKKILGGWAKEESRSDFLFLHTFPLKLCQFYTMPKDESYGDSLKLLYKGVEVATGGQRIHDLKLLKSSMMGKKMNQDNFIHYIEAFELGIPPHGGASMGIPRFVALMKNLVNIKEAIYFPRDPRRLSP